MAEEQSPIEIQTEGISLISVEEPAEEISEKVKPKKDKARTKNRLIAIMGAIILVFALIGLVFTVTKGVNGIVDLATNRSEKEEFATFLYPVVMQDPPEFESVDKLGSGTMLSAAAWDLILYDDTSKYPRDEFGFITVPQSDLEMHATKLFGDGLTFEHQSLGDAEFSFTYNEEDGTYNLSDSLLFFTYVPKVTQIVREDKTVRLTVEYHVPDVGIVSRGQSDEPVKIMEYALEERDNGGYKITSLKIVLSSNAVSNSESSELSGSASSPETTDMSAG